MATSPLSAWKSRFDSVVNRPPREVTTLKVTLDATVVAKEKLTTLATVIDERAAEWVGEFIESRVFQLLESQYSGLNSGAFAPQMFKKDGSSALQKVDVEGSSRGHKAFLAAMKTTGASSRGPGRRVGTGVFSLQSVNYTDHETNKIPPLNTWFFAVEFGTGVDEFVGPGWAKGPGESPGGKSASSGKNVKENDGSWWIGPGFDPGEEPRGAHMKGKPGAFGLFEKSATRRPQEVWLKLFQEEFPLFINERINDILS